MDAPGLLSGCDNNPGNNPKFACLSLIVNEELDSVVSRCDVAVGEGNALIMGCSTRSTSACVKVQKSFSDAQNKRALRAELARAHVCEQEAAPIKSHEEYKSAFHCAR